MTTRGKYIVIEGQDGTGKSTQVALLRKKLAALGIDSIGLREPGGTPIADRVSSVIKNGHLERTPETNLLLFTANRRESWAKATTALDRGTWVIAERNYFSTLAYQGYGEGLDHNLIVQITKKFTDDLYMTPDLAVILSLDDEIERTKRINERGDLAAPDTFESREAQFQIAVKEGYMQVASEYNVPIISSSRAKEVIATEIYSLIRNLPN